MTFRPSVLPDRDSGIIGTFTRAFERTRGLLAQDAADRRAQEAFDTEQRGREADIESSLLESRLRIAEDPGLSTGREAPITRAFRQQGGAVSPAGTPNVSRSLSQIAREAAGPERQPIGRLGEEDVFFTPGKRRAQQEEDVRSEFALEEELAEPERERERQARTTERGELSSALDQIPGMTPERRRALIRDPEAARRVIARETEEEGGGTRTTAGERGRTQLREGIVAEAESRGLTLVPGELERLVADRQAREDFFAIIRPEEIEIIQDRIDAVTEALARIERDQDMTVQEANSARRRAYRESGFTGPDDLNQERQRITDAAGGRRNPEEVPGTGAAATPDALDDGTPAPRRRLSDQQVSDIAAQISDLPEEEREAEIRKFLVDVRQEDIDAILASVG